MTSLRSFLLVVGIVVVGTPGVAREPPAAATDPTREPSLETKIGQMLMVGFRGRELPEDATILDDLRVRNLGGVVLYYRDVPTDTLRRNLDTPRQVKRLIEQLRGAASSRPLLVAVDQEGGRVRRLRTKFGLGDRRTAEELAATGVAATRGHARLTAKTLAELGFNLNFAPVVDLDINPLNPAIGEHGRSYGREPQVVAEHALAFIQAHHEHGVLTAIKHFPGHGSSREDSHLGLPDITHSWTAMELEPFRAIIAAKKCDTVMTAHLFHHGLDPVHPATVSGSIVNGVLRQKLGFEGVVITDDLQMSAISKHYGFERALELAIGASADILMFSNNSVYDEHVTARAVATVKKLVKEGKVTPAQIDRAFRRIQRLKAPLAPPDPP